MKKRSILLTCIVAVMALAMFVGCDNAPVLPSFVVGGTINQTGDFLEGQTFDPSKFTVTITYDNGRIVAADETVSVYLDTDRNGDGKVNAGDTVKADLGKNYADSDICATATVRVYSLKSIAVTGPESYAVADPSSPYQVPASDLTVTATYLDSNNAEKTMVLVPGEYTVDTVDLSALSEDNPTVEASATVTAKVGVLDSDTPISTQFDFTATWNGESTKLPDGAVVSRIEVAFADSVTEYSLAKLDYGTELPAVDASKLSVTAYVGEDGYTVDSSDVTFTWVDKDGFEFSSNNLLSDNESGVGILAEFAGVSYLFTDTDLTLATVTVTVERAGTYEAPDLVAGADLPDLSSMLKAYYQVGSGTKVRIAPEDDTLTWVFASKGDEYGSVSGSTHITDGKLPATDTYVIVYPVYKGQAATQGVALGQTTDLVVTVESIEVTLVEGFEGPAAQYYDSLSTLTEFDESAAIESVTYVMSDGSEREFAWADASATAEYYLNGAPLSELEATADGDYDLNVDSLDIHVVYGEVSVDVPVATTDAEATTLEVTATVVKASDATTVVGMPVEYTIVTSNGSGAVDKDFTDVVVLSNGYAAELPSAVTATSQTFNVYAAGDYDLATTVTVEAGASYIAPGNLAFTANDEEALFAVGTVINQAFVNANFTLDNETYEVIAGNGEPASITVTGVNLPSTKVLETGTNVIPVTVSYRGAEGTTVTATVNLTVTGTAYITSPTFSLMYNNEPITGLVVGRSYNRSGFSVNPSSYTAVGNNPETSITSITFNGGEVESSFTVENAYQTFVFGIQYMSGSTSGSGITLNPAASQNVTINAVAAE